MSAACCEAGGQLLLFADSLQQLVREYVGLVDLGQRHERLTFELGPRSTEQRRQEQRVERLVLVSNAALQLLQPLWIDQAASRRVAGIALEVRTDGDDARGQLCHGQRRLARSLVQHVGHRHRLFACCFKFGISCGSTFLKVASMSSTNSKSFGIAPMIEVLALGTSYLRIFTLSTGIAIMAGKQAR
jgi:hypothetical protein